MKFIKDLDRKQLVSFVLQILVIVGVAITLLVLNGIGLNASIEHCKEYSLLHAFFGVQLAFILIMVPIATFVVKILEDLGKHITGCISLVYFISLAVMFRMILSSDRCQHTDAYNYVINILGVYVSIIAIVFVAVIIVGMCFCIK